MNTRPHVHYCPKCDRGVECQAAADGGCILGSTSPMTCNPCAEAALPLTPGGELQLTLGAA